MKEDDPILNPDLCELPRWRQFKQQLNNLDWDEFYAGLDKEGVTFIDARTPQEYDVDALDGAININYLSANLVDQLEQLPREHTYYVYCRTSRRSVRVCTLMQNMDFSKVYHLQDGLMSRPDQ